jgi:hypothetical protein
MFTCDYPRLVFTVSLPASADHRTLVHCNGLIIMGMAAALALCTGLTWYRLVRSTRALCKEEEEAASQEAVVEREHKNAVVPVI